ncbi:peptidoglycan DD-metalloendopeptidase family protein [Cohnella suwonensis]|uniref:Peptidoglycan DD-metalloendopeptidase family protein n=1 Tax=Cohnella suwonensis TaxID=696072 RepID=A0ABW0LUT5_9BACL
MADFRGMDRIRTMIAATRHAVRNVRSSRMQAKLSTDTQVTSNFAARWRNYRKPIIISACGIIALAVVGFGASQYVKANSVTYYEVLLNGSSVGEISDKAKVEQLLAAKATELSKANTPVLQELNDGQVAYEVEKAYKKKTDDGATLTRLEGLLQTHAVGVKVVVDGKEIGVVRDQQTANLLLQKVKNKYVPANLVKKAGTEVQSLSTSKTAAADQAKPQRVVTSVSFKEKVQTVEADIAATQVSTLDALYAKLTKGEPVPRKYTVQEGDCIGCIAAKMDVTEEFIHQKNKWIVGDKIKVGDVIDLSSQQPPILNVNSEEQVTEIETIEPPVQYKTSDTMKKGQQKVITAGTPGKQQVTYRLTKRNGALIEEEQVNKKVLLKPVPTVIMKGTKVIRGEGSGKFAWPVVGARITSYLGQRWGRMHKGIDMVGQKSIMAADEGIIEFAGYKSGGLGNAVIINHQNGFKTVYGHMKSVKVKKGQVVEKGDSIGIMGSTGHSTGTHLHFEIYLNGKLKNPTSYL